MERCRPYRSRHPASHLLHLTLLVLVHIGVSLALDHQPGPDVHVAAAEASKAKLSSGYLKQVLHSSNGHDDSYTYGGSCQHYESHRYYEGYFYDGSRRVHYSCGATCRCERGTVRCSKESCNYNHYNPYFHNSNSGRWTWSSRYNLFNKPYFSGYNTGYHYHFTPHFGGGLHSGIGAMHHGTFGDHDTMLGDHDGFDHSGFYGPTDHYGSHHTGGYPDDTGYHGSPGYHSNYHGNHDYHPNGPSPTYGDHGYHGSPGAHSSHPGHTGHSGSPKSHNTGYSRSHSTGYSSSTGHRGTHSTGYSEGHSTGFTHSTGTSSGHYYNSNNKKQKAPQSRKETHTYQQDPNRYDRKGSYRYGYDGGRGWASGRRTEYNNGYRKSSNYRDPNGQGYRRSSRYGQTSSRSYSSNNQHADQFQHKK